MKIALPRSMALKIADYLEADADRIEGCYWDFAQGRVTPRNLRLEMERVRQWAKKIRAASEPLSHTSPDNP